VLVPLAFLPSPSPVSATLAAKRRRLPNRPETYIPTVQAVPGEETISQLEKQSYFLHWQTGNQQKEKLFQDLWEVVADTAVVWIGQSWSICNNFCIIFLLIWEFLKLFGILYRVLHYIPNLCTTKNRSTNKTPNKCSRTS